VIALYVIHQQQTGVTTMDLAALTSTTLPPDVQLWLFLAFTLAFAIKVPLFHFTPGSATSTRSRPSHR